MPGSVAKDIEYRLCQRNLVYMRDKTYMQVPRDMNHKIVEKLSESMYIFKAYPVMSILMMLHLHYSKNSHALLNQAVMPITDLDTCVQQFLYVISTCAVMHAASRHSTETQHTEFQEPLVKGEKLTLFIL